MLGVVHKAHHRHAAGGEIHHFGQQCFIAKAQACNAQLARKLFGAKILVGGHGEQIKAGFLAVAQKQVFADAAAQGNRHIVTVGHGGGSGVIDAVILDVQAV